MKLVKLEDVCYSGSSNISQKDVMILDGSYPIYGASGFIKNINFYKSEKPYIAIVKDGSGVGRTMILPEKSSVIGTMQYIFPRDNIDIRYLYYAITSMDLSKYCTGIAIPHIYFKDYKKEKLNLPSISEQVNIANKLDLVQKIIDLKQQQIKNLDELIKSQFVEMFLKNEFPKEKLENNVEEMFIGPFGSALKNKCFVEENNGYCVVYEQKHAIYKNIEDFRWIDKDKYESLKRFNVQPKDIIVSCRGTIGKTFVIPENAPLGIMHPSIMKIRLKKEKYIPEFFEMLLQHYFHEKENQTNGATIKMGIKASTLEKEDFIIPDMELQIKYLTFVKQIDKQKFILGKSLKETEELKKSLMNKYFG